MDRAAGEETVLILDCRLQKILLLSHRSYYLQSPCWFNINRICLSQRQVRSSWGFSIKSSIFPIKQRVCTHPLSPSLSPFSQAHLTKSIKSISSSVFSNNVLFQARIQLLTLRWPEHRGGFTMSALPGSAAPWGGGQMVQGPSGRHTRAGPAVAVRGLAGGSAHVQL